MRTIMAAILLAIPLMSAPAIAQNQNVQNEADKGINSADKTSGAATSPSAQNSGAGIAGAPGNKNGPSAKGTVGAASHNSTVQQQDPSNIKGLPGNKSGPPAKR